MAHSGAMVVMLGPDGSGKSSVISALEQRIFDGGTLVHTMHFRPMLERWGQNFGTSVVTDPHGQAPRSAIASAAKLAFYLGDCALGYLILVLPKLRHGDIILWDRYFMDMIIDPRRYRFGGWHFLVRLAWKIVPKPDAVFLLDAPMETLQCRKQEVPAAETERQRSLYREFVKTLPNARIIDATQPLDSVVASAYRAIIEYMGQKQGFPEGRH